MIDDLVHHEINGDATISYEDVCEWAVKRFKLACTGHEFWMASPTGNLSHVFTACEIFHEEQRLKREMTPDEITVFLHSQMLKFFQEFLKK